MIVWVLFPALKVHFYHKEVLNMLGNLIGRTIKLDFHTLNLQRAKFARIAVEVDLSKPLVPRIWLDDAWQKVEYENLPEVCFECGKIGHISASCPVLRPAVLPMVSTVSDGQSQAFITEAAAEEPSPGFGPWMLVTRRNRRNLRDPSQKGKAETESKIPNGERPAKNGRDGTITKEGEIVSPVAALAISNSSQRSGPQERKGGAGRMGPENLKNTKSVDISKGKGVLGPGPDKKDKKGSKPSAELGQSSTSAQVQNSTSQMTKNKAQVHPQLQSSLATPMTDDSSGKVNSQLPPLTVTSITGKNGTNMQIVDLVNVPGGRNDKQVAAPPSTKSRTKGSKARKEDRRQSPIKVSPMKSLQVWTPKKDRKSKSRAKIATLTMQEITAWTNAAKMSSSASGKEGSIYFPEDPKSTSSPPIQGEPDS
ncbi:unnamed protein product [Linum tenue]|uniref:CCHC-type domain-containing protein n=1 Tax=Linum tenue TaxID=586396 RepID=A0AAV0JED5_9ROSI|nr:unnamed protein product [Linum tenue]